MSKLPKRSDELKLVIENKDRAYFEEKGLPFPKYWYGYKNLPKSQKRHTVYSTEMRELSNLSTDELAVLEMFWGLSKFKAKLLDRVDPEFVYNIPVPTPVRINALVQTKLSMLNSEERKEWADRVEGKTVSREVSMSLSTVDESETSANSTRQLILSKFDELGDAWKDYGKDLDQKQLNYTATQYLEDSSNGQTEG